MESKNNNLKCAFCRGKGIHPNSERLPCVVCRGRGKIEISQPYIKCEECGGSGRKLGTNLYCLSCRGKGFVEGKIESGKADIAEKSLEEITKKLEQTEKKIEKKTKEIKKKFEAVKPFIKKISAKGRSASDGKKEASWLNLIKKEWKSIWGK